MGRKGKGKGRAIVEDESDEDESHSDDAVLTEASESQEEPLETSERTEELLAEAEERFLRSSPDLFGASLSDGPAYVVYRGKKTGIFRSWHATMDQITGYRGSHQQRFESVADAIAAWRHALAMDAGPARRPSPRSPILPSVSAGLPPRAGQSRRHPQPKRPVKPEENNTPSSTGHNLRSHASSKAVAPSARATRAQTKASKSALPEVTSSVSSPGSSLPKLPKKQPVASGSRTQPLVDSALTADSSSNGWYVVYRGIKPGAYSDRSSAVEALGRSRESFLEKTATAELAYKLFTLAFMGGLVVVTDV